MEQIMNENEFQSILDAPNVISNDLLSIVTTTTNEIWLASYCSLDHHCHVYRYTTRMEKLHVFSFQEEMKSIQLQQSSLVQVYGLSKNDCIVVASSTTVVVVERNKSWLWGMDTIRYWKNDWFLIYSTTITFQSAILWNCQTKQRQVVTLPETTTHAFTTTSTSTIHWMGWNAKTCTIHHSILHHPNQSTTTTVVPWILPSSTIIIHLHHDEKKKELYIITTMGQIYIYNYSLSTTTTTPKIIQPSIQLIHTPIQSACITTNHVLFYNTIQNGNVYYTSTILNKKDNVQPQKLPIQNTICHLQSSSISSSTNEDDDTTIVMFASTTSHRLQVFQMNNNNNNMNQTNMNIDLQSFFQSTTKKTLINNNTETNEYDSIIQQLRTIACQSSSPTTTTTTIETSQDEDNHLNLQLPINHTISKDVMTKTYHVLYNNYNTTLIHHPKSEQQQPLYHYTTNSHSSSFLLPDQTDDLNSIPVFYNGTVISYCSNNKQTNSSTKLPLWNRNPIQILTSRSIPFPKQQQQIIQSSKHVTQKRKQNSSSHYHGHPYLYSKRCKTYNKEFDYTQYQYINDDVNQTICHGQIMIDSFHHHDIFHPMIKQQSQQIIEYSHLSSWQRKQNQILQQQQQQQAYRLPMDQEISILSKYKQQQQISTESKSTTNNNNVQHLRFYYSPSSTNLSSLLNIPNKNNDDDQVLMVHHNKGGIYSSCMVVGKYNERVPPSMFVDLAISARSQLEALNIALLVRSSIMKQLSKRELPPIKDFKMIQKIATYLSMKLHNHTEKTITMDDVLQLYCQIRSLPLVIE